MHIKLIAFDLDYTLLHTGGALSSFTAETLKEAKDRGFLLAPVTGRGLCELTPFLDKLCARYLVMVNGSVIYDALEKQYIYKELPNQKSMIEALKKALDLGIYAEAYCGDVYTNAYCYENMKALGMPEDQVPLFRKTRTVLSDFYGEMKRRGQVEKLHLIFKDVADKEARQGILMNHPDFSYTSSYPNNLEISSRLVNKASGLLALTKILNILPEEVMAIGDGANDACMLKMAGLGVAVANATPEAKNAADVLTDTNDADGAVKAIRKWAF